MPAPVSSKQSPLTLVRRLRRLREHPGVRGLVQETRLAPTDFIMPFFITEGPKEALEALPGQWRLPIEDLLKHCEQLVNLGILGLCLFPCLGPKYKTPCASAALDPDGLVVRALLAVKAAFPQLVLMSDVALDPYTDHGHDGLLCPQGHVDNDATVQQLCQVAVLHAQAGADWVGPSDMMDGRVGAIRRALDKSGHERTGIISYSAKFSSAYYGPFRQALGNKEKRALDKRSYQLDPANGRQALLEAQLDEDEGADILLVKPAGLYLDVISQLRQKTLLPIAAYQVSGEYAQIHAAAQRGWLDLNACMHESLLAIKRAGAEVILSYFAVEAVKGLRSF